MNIPDIFHPLIRKWFAENVGKPTDVQTRAWREISAGNHVLATAPTGSGKTLAAFLWSVDRLVTGAWEPGQVRVLYVSPLKALNNDVCRNLVKPLAELKTFFTREDREFPVIRVLTRSGDTASDERRRMLRTPPEILITTPESLNILLTSKNSRRMLAGIEAVILDEIHAVVGSKRGVHLITAVDRLVNLCGEFQRIALSATVRPLDQVADFVGGYRQTETGYEKRRVSVIRSDQDKRYAIRVRFPERLDDTAKKGFSHSEEDAYGSVWPALVRSFKAVIRENRSTLFFANSRRTAEKAARLINEEEPEDLAYSHHGSLSKEIRLAVEHKLKNGELKAIVATSTLELGIDIGDLDHVALIQTPPSVSSAIQRIGRAGHSVGLESRGDLFPTHGRDLVNAAVLARCVIDHDLESVTPAVAPLDVLAQVILSMTEADTWDLDELYDFIRTSHPYRDLPRRQYDLVLEMLAGGYAGTRLRELRTRVYIDRVDNTVKAKKGSALLVYMSGGTIPDRGYFNLRIRDSKAKIGELDEEFVWERKLGETFAMGAQTWRILNITHNDVEVAPTGSAPGIIPFWKAEAMNRDFHFSMKIADFLEQADTRLNSDARASNAFAEWLMENHFMERGAADELVDFLKSQKQATGAKLPHRHHLLIEHFDDPLNRADSKQMIFHTLWGGKLNRPFAVALAGAWEEKYGFSPEIFPDNDAILLHLPHDMDTSEILQLVTAENIDSLLRNRLEKTGLFGAAFRENAGRALLLPKMNMNKRMPLWLNRLRAKKLLDAVKPFPDFPILLETWRTCLNDEFDLENLKTLLHELADGEIEIGEAFTTSPSPFANGMIWQRTNHYMYVDDSPTQGSASSLSDELIQEVVGSSRLRPKIPYHLINALDHKLKRTAEGYAPGSSVELLQWTVDRFLIPENEWATLVSAIERDHGTDRESLIASLTGKIGMIQMPGAKTHCVCAVENLPRIAAAFDSAIETLSPLPECENLFSQNGRLENNIARQMEKHADTHGENGGSEDDSQAGIIAGWLAYYGPVQTDFVNAVFGIGDGIMEDITDFLVKNGDIIRDVFRENSDVVEICDRNNLETMLRILRKSRRPDFKALASEYLPLFLAAWQGVASRGESMEDFQDRLDRLFGYPAPAGAWEEHILPARMRPYFPAWLDSLMQSSELTWLGCGDKKLGFAFSEDAVLFRDPSNAEETESVLAQLMPDRRGRFGFFDIVAHSGLSSAKAAEKLWDLAWKGRVANDSFAVVRKGLANDFKADREKGFSHSQGHRGRFNRWKSSRPLPGNWHAVNIEPDTEDILETGEIMKDRVRLLFRRYGILFREILAKELPVFAWGNLFRTLRLMELSGEIFSGHFFEGIPGVQFVSGEAFRFINRALPEDAVFWMNAADPASLCGIGPDSIRKRLPARLPTSWLVFHGTTIVLIAKRNGKILEILADPDHPFMPTYLSVFKDLMGRNFNPIREILVETINGEPALLSPYAPALKAFGFTDEYKGLELRRSFFF